MSKSNKVLNLKDKISDNEMDLSLCNLTEVPFKELALFTKATILDLSCNNLPSLPPEFCNLTHLVKLDLSKNQLTRLPDDLGNLTSLQHLDLYNNNLRTLPVSFSQLRSLKWLDLKDNPLDAGLAKAAGDCLDEKQCKQCATRNILHKMEAQRIRGQFEVKGPERMVLKHMQILQDEADRAREKRLLREKELEKKREAKKREREAREKEARKREKAEEKEKRRKEYNAQVAAAAAVIQEQKQQQQQQKKTEERKSKKKNGQASAGKKSGAVAASKPCRSVLGVLFKLSLVLLLCAAIIIATCRLTELKREDVCVSVDAALDQSLTWARKQEGVVRHLLGDLSAAVKDFLESMQTSKS